MAQQEEYLSTRVQDVMRMSRDEAIRLGNDTIGMEHIMLGILKEGDGIAIKILQNLDVNVEKLTKEVEASVHTSGSVLTIGNIPLTKQAEKILKVAFLEAKVFKSEKAGTEHLLLAILREADSPLVGLLQSYDCTYENATEQLDNIISGKIGEKRTKTNDGEKEKSKTPLLDELGRDLTKLASEEKLDPVIGRANEIERVTQILARKKKNNPLLIGEAGVGKTAIAEGLAIRIAQKKVPRVLFDKRVCTLELASLVAGTQFRGQFEQRLKKIIKELEANPDVIVFIDEIHTLIGAGNQAGALDAANILKPALARGEMKCIGATTLNEYRESIEKDGALNRRFRRVMINEPSPEEALDILKHIKTYYEDHHKVVYSDQSLIDSVKLSVRYISDRHLPDKAIDLMDEAGAKIHVENFKVTPEILEMEKELESIIALKNEHVRKQEFEQAGELKIKQDAQQKLVNEAVEIWKKDIETKTFNVDSSNVADIVSMETGIPVNNITELETTKLVRMATELKGKIIGQDEAVVKITEAIQRSRAGLKDPARPIGSFIFLGQTGVGKTELAKALARYLFNSEDNLIRVDMSEYGERHTVSRLVGSPPGYVGYDEGGQLTEKVRRKPYSVVLFDEIEKAHPDVFNIFLQILDDGHLTDAQGRKVDFKNTIIIMTSNVGTKELKKQGNIGFGENSKDDSTQVSEQISSSMKRMFNPEFLNRIDDTIVFNALTQEDIIKIIHISLDRLLGRVKEMGIQIKINQSALEYVAKQGFDKQYGARPLRRAIQKYIETPIAQEILNQNISSGHTITFDRSAKSTDDKLTYKIKKSKNNSVSEDESVQVEQK